MADTVVKHPLFIGGITWLVCTLALVIPTGIILTPKGKTRDNAQGDFDTAQSTYDQNNMQLMQAESALTIARQKVIDIDCVISGADAFNEQLTVFYYMIKNATQPPVDYLASQFFLTFEPNRKEDTQSSKYPQYRRLVKVFGPYWDCYGEIYCGKDTRCCTLNTWHDEWRWEKYEEITRVKSTYTNIVSGTGRQAVPLNCRHYSRAFSISSPNNYVTRETPQTSFGSPEAGKVYIDIEREYGCKVPTSYTLDGNVVSNPIIVSDSSSQSAAASNLATQLLQFLGTAVAAFNASNTNYPALQTTIRESIPSLETSVTSANMTFFSSSQLLADKKAVLNTADSDFNSGMALWLSLLFVAPAVIAVIAAAIACKVNSSRSNDLSSDREMYSFN